MHRILYVVLATVVLVNFSCKTVSPEKKVETISPETLDIAPVKISIVDPKTEPIELLSPGYFERVRVAFYNLENLFDTIDGPNDDAEYLPNSPRKWDSQKYRSKLKNLARVIDSIEPHILGVCEVENAQVLVDLKSYSSWLSLGYANIVHQESPDKRGIDVALFYTPEWAFYGGSGVHLKESNDKAISSGTLIEVPTGNPEKPTRSILRADFERNGQPFSVFVNHWPSRSGGELNTRVLRQNAAKALKNHIDSDKNLKSWIAMGDFNDNPEDSSLVYVLEAAGSQAKAVNLAYELRQVNPLLGTGLYKEKWDMFDQIIVSRNLYHLGPNAPIPSIEIYKREWLLQTEGTYQGHPLRTFGGKTYLNGYSDHLPVFADLYILMP